MEETPRFLQEVLTVVSELAALAKAHCQLAKEP